MDILSPILFYIVASGLLLMAVGVVFSPRVIYSILCAFIAFILTAFIYFMLNAPFNAAVQIAIYGVAVSILFIFAVMMTGYHKEKNLYIAIAPRTLLAAAGIFFTLLSMLIFAIEDYREELVDSLITTKLAAFFDTTLSIAKGIFTDYIFAYEILSVFLLIAVVGVGAILTFKKMEGK